VRIISDGTAPVQTPKWLPRSQVPAASSFTLRWKHIPRDSWQLP